MPHRSAGAFLKAPLPATLQAQESPRQGSGGDAEGRAVQSLAVTGGDDHAHSEDDNPNHDDTVMVGAFCQWRAHSLITVSKAGPMVVAIWVCRAGGGETLQGISVSHRMALLETQKPGPMRGDKSLWSSCVHRQTHATPGCLTGPSVQNCFAGKTLPQTVPSPG